MKKILIPAAALLFAVCIACNNSGKKDDQLKAQAESLENEVVAGHDIAMPKSMKIPGLQKETNRLIDSISKLPAKAQEAAAPYKTKLEGLLKDLDYADAAMNKWMNEFVFDSAKNDLEQRIKYLTGEKTKIENVKEVVLGSLQKADSLLKH